jgi:multiple sugar transport system substrate-binding protein
MVRKCTLVLVALLMVFSLAACAGNTENSSAEKKDSGITEGETKTLQSWGETIKEKYGGTEINLAFASHPSTDSFEKMTKDFEELTGIKVKWEVMEETYLKNKQLLDYTGKSGRYDVLMVDGLWMNEYGAKKIVEPMDQYINDKAITPEWFDYEDIVPAYRNGISQYDGKTYGIPTAGETRFIAYRKDLFEKYDKQPPETMDEFLELAKFFNGKEEDLYGVSMRAQRGIHAASGLMTIMYNFGGGFIDPKSEKVTINDSKTIEAIEFYVDLLKNAPKDVGTYTHEEALSAFTSGKAAMWLDATALANRILDPNSSEVFDKVGFAPTPEGPGGRASALAGWNMSLSSLSKNKDAAWAFIIYMNSKEKAKEYVSNGGIPVRTSVYEDEELAAENSSFPVQLQALEDANVLVEKGISWIPQNERLGQALDRIGYFISSALEGSLTAEEAAEQAQKEIEEIVGK